MANAAQGRGGQATNQNLMGSSQNPYAQFEVEYPEKLKSLFEDDAADEEYKVPFKSPTALMEHFENLEEDNLTLIL